MKLKHTLVLLLVAGALFAYIWFVERHGKTSREAEEQASHLVQVDRDKVDAVSIKNAEAKIELRKRDGNWFLEEPIKDRADAQAVTQLFTTIETLRHAATIDPESKDVDKKIVKDSGVEDSQVKVSFRGSDKPVEITLGKEAAVEGKVYARVEGAKTLYVIGNELKNQIAKKPDDFRDKKLADLSLQQIQKVSVRTANGEMELEKKNNHWSISKPLQARGDDSKVGDLVAQISNARIDQFIADQNLGAYGLTEPRGTVTFTVEGKEQPVVLQIGGNPSEEKDKEKTYVKLSTRDSVVLVPKASVEKLLETRPNDLRDRNLARVEKDIVDRITIEPAGGEKLVLARKGEGWVRKIGDQDVAINDAVPTRLLADLQTTQVTNFVADVANDLPKYGLDQPRNKVTFSSYSSENTPETAAGDKPIVSVLFGKVEGDNGYAKLDTEPFIVAVPKTLIESIPTDPIQLQELTIYPYKPEEITNLEITKPDQPTLTLERGQNGTWKLAKGDAAVNQLNLQSLLGSLSHLNAVRWLGPAKADYGLDKPAMTVSFTATQGDKKIPGKLAIGIPTPEDYWPAMAEGKNGVFAISRPDHEALGLPLVDSPATSAPVPVPTSPGAPAAPAVAPASPAPQPMPAAPAAVPTPPEATPAPPAASAPAPEVPPAAAPVPPPTPAAPAPEAPPATPTPSTPAAEASAAPAPAAPAPAPAPPAGDAPQPPAPQ